MCVCVCVCMFTLDLMYFFPSSNLAPDTYTTLRTPIHSPTSTQCRCPTLAPWRGPSLSPSFDAAAPGAWRGNTKPLVWMQNQSLVVHETVSLPSHRSSSKEEEGQSWLPCTERGVEQVDMAMQDHERRMLYHICSNFSSKQCSEIKHHLESKMGSEAQRDE